MGGSRRIKREGGDRLAAAALADQRQGFAGIDVEADAVHRDLTRKADREIAHVEHAAPSGEAGARIEHVVQPVADQVERQHRERDGAAGQRA